MHIPQLNIEDPSFNQISRPLPMESNAGWYLGSVYWSEAMKHWAPNNRVSHYMQSRSDVVQYMDYEALGIDLEDLAAEHEASLEEFAEAYRTLDGQGMENHEAMLELLDYLAYRSSDLISEVDCHVAESGIGREVAQ